MAELHERTTRRWIAALSGVALLAGVVGFEVGRSTAPPPPEPAPPTPTPAPEPAPPTPLAEGPADRALILRALDAAADRAAGGTAEDRLAAGRRFTMAIAFGCGGGAAKGADAAPVEWRYDAASKSLRIQVDPMGEIVPALVSTLPAADPEKGADLPAIVIDRPWTAGASCPAEAAGTAPTDGKRALVEPADPDPARAARPVKPYRAVVKRDADKLPTYLLLQVEGRVAAFADGETARCVATPSGRPDCWLAVDWDRLAVVDPTDNSVLTEWRD